MIKRSVDFSEKFIKWFSELNNKDIPIAGGKGASLAEMYNAKFPVPPAFVITSQAFEFFITHHGLRDKINEIIGSIDFENTQELEDKAKQIREMMLEQKMPEVLESEIKEAYGFLSSDNVKHDHTISRDALNILRYSREPSFVSVRSSATTEDLADASFAGQQETFLNVKGDRSLIENVKKCFASLYTARAVYYRHKKGFKDALLAVVVQKMIDSEKSGVVFSKDPTNRTKDIIVEAVFGLGEGIVSGRINPDNYVVSSDLKIKSVNVAIKKIAIVKAGSGETGIVKLNPEKSKSQVLTNGQILAISNYALKLEEHYKKPQDIEFAFENNELYILQSRPITTLKERTEEKEISGKILLQGQGASPGIGVGTVRIIKTMDDLVKIKKGDVLVTEMTNPDMVVSMQKSAAIVTDEGGLTSHAAIVSREMGIPAVVGTDEATSVLQDGMKITVDGNSGKVFEGQVTEAKAAEIKPAVKTNKVKIKIILDLPEFAKRAAQSEVDAVGLLRIEGIIASSGKHPLSYEKENKIYDYVELLRKGIDKISEHFNSVWIRTSDIRTDEFGDLRGAPEKELNPMLGFHGIRFSLKHPELFKAELSAIRKVADKYSNKKFGIMFPQVISAEEVKEAKKYFEEIKTENMEFGVMIETPAAVQVIEEICKIGIDFVSFGTNDLTQFTLAIDRGNEDVQYIYNEMHPAILSEIRKVIYICRRYNVQTSICGQAGSRKEMAEFLFRQGINSISVNADAAYDVSLLIKELEERPIEKSIEKPVFERREPRPFSQNRNFDQNRNQNQNFNRFEKNKWRKFNKFKNRNPNNQNFNQERKNTINSNSFERPVNYKPSTAVVEDIDNLNMLRDKGNEIQEEFHRQNLIETEREKDRIEVEKEDFNEPEKNPKKVMMASDYLDENEYKEFY